MYDAHLKRLPAQNAKIIFFWKITCIRDPSLIIFLISINIKIWKIRLWTYQKEPSLLRSFWINTSKSCVWLSTEASSRISNLIAFKVAVKRILKEHEILIFIICIFTLKIYAVVNVGEQSLRISSMKLPKIFKKIEERFST